MCATAKRPDDFDPRLAWSILGDGDYHGNLKVKGFLASSDRLLHHMLIQAVNARSSSEEKVTVQDLWLLEQLSTDDKYPNAPYLMAAQLAKASGYREGSRIVGGQYVTLLAKHFGILTDAAIASMTNLGEMGLIDMDQLRGMGVARVEHMVGRDYNAWIRNPQAYRSQPRIKNNVLSPNKRILQLWECPLKALTRVKPGIQEREHLWGILVQEVSSTLLEITWEKKK
ncbi:hypothetical protein OSB04_020488 [Centaurea solstitialis]|uniref:Uncharacterized protein n=1 Tax=Centaurea solstitialis TaxID=347529 RepID=A0AA38T4G9_9ASTR|nr:hypothetical protein OSB04_020488 [Centaurea solstitialis]